MQEDRRLDEALPRWNAPPAPRREPLEGRLVRLEPMDADRHAAELHRAFSRDTAMWDYLPYGPFASAAGYHRWVREFATGEDPLFYAVRDLAEGRCIGVASFLRIKPESGSLEIGHVAFSSELRQTAAATEVFYLMMRWAFGAGYRRLEWKCDATNLASRRAAERLGLSYEGTFRQANVVRGRNRDTAWFAAIDKDWSALEEAFRAWLEPANFGATGRQRERLGNLTSLVRVSSDPMLRDLAR